MNPSFVSYAQNAEDVILWRALRDVREGVYVDVGANDPEVDSVTKAFYDRGWWGLDVEPVLEFADALRRERGRDVVAQVAVSTRDEGEVVLHEFEGTGLSTLREEYVRSQLESGHTVRHTSVAVRTLTSLVAEHLAGVDVHFLKVDVEGAEAEVLSSVDLRAWRPWVVVVEATRPNSTEPTHDEWEPALLASGYRLCLFDGVSRYYVSDERAERLQPLLSYPACSLDDYSSSREHGLQTALDRALRHNHVQDAEMAQIGDRLSRVQALETEVETLRAELVRWRGVVLERWSSALGGWQAPAPDDAARAELVAMRRTLSWRITAPLRSVRERQRRLAA